MFLKALLVAVFAVVVLYLLNCAVLYDFFRKHHRNYPGECRQVKGIDFGSEDMAVTSNGLAFITSGMIYQPVAQTFKDFVKANNPRGHIFLFDFNETNSAALDLPINAGKEFNPDTFHPHGISLLEDKVKGEHLLYVINHADPDVDRVEKFRFLPKTQELVYVKSIFNDKFYVTNDLAVVEEDKFYITNFLRSFSYLFGVAEMLLWLPTGSVVYYNGTDSVKVVPHSPNPNGMILSKDKKYAYVSMPVLKGIDVYERREDNSFTLIQTVPLFTVADNLHLSTSGDALFAGAHPVAYELFLHLNDPTWRSSSMVLYLPLRDGKVVTEEIREIFYDPGDLISGSTVASVYNNHLLIGSVMNKLVICNLNLKF